MKIAVNASTQAASKELTELQESIYTALCDDLNTPIALARLFEAVTWINSAADKNTVISPADKKLLEDIFDNLVEGILGLQDSALQDNAPLIDGLMQMILEFRAKAKAQKEWAISDNIRNTLNALGVTLKDTKDGTEWSI